MAAERVLIVDDNPFNVKLAQRLLTLEGFDVRHATTPDDVLEIVTTWAPRLILMDLQLPGIDGLTLTRRIRADPAHDQIVIVAFSAQISPADERHALDAGFDGYIAKPIDTRQFGSLVRRQLASRRAR